MKKGTIKELLQSHGIRTNQDLYAWLKRQPSKPGQSNYSVMVSRFGEANADKIMRLLEIAECHNL